MYPNNNNDEKRTGQGGQSNYFDQYNANESASSANGVNASQPENHTTYHYTGSQLPYNGEQGYQAPNQNASPYYGSSIGGQPGTSYSSYSPAEPRMKNWNGSYSAGGTVGAAVAKPKKERKGLKITAIVLAFMLFSFGFGYLGSMAGNYTSGAAGAGGGTAPAPVTTTSSSSGESGAETTTQKVAAATANSIVEITTESVTTDSYFRQRITSGAGSGVIVSADGYIATNNHVVSGANKITVTLKNGTQYEATLIGTDPQTDLAVVKIEETGLQPAIFGDSSTLEVGEPAIVIGNPLGQLGGTVTDGIISALDREITIEGQVMTLLQTNAAINPGNSGGGLFNQKGELVGVVNAKSGGENIEGLGFAIPSNIAKPVIDDIIANGYVQGRPQIGISLLDVDDAMTAMMYGLNSTGVYVMGVTEGSSAEQAGIQAGDRIVSVAGKEVTSSADVTSTVSEHQVGDQIEIVISRNGRTGTTTVTLQENKGNS